MPRQVLLVEGDDDVHVLRAICRGRGIPEPEVVPPRDGGIDALLRMLPGRLQESSEPGDAVGVVVDADTCLDARWQAIRDRLAAVGYQDAPASPDPSGTVLEAPSGSLLPRVGVWLMPDNSTPGILEDFLRFLVPRPDALFDHAFASVASLPERRFVDNDEPKALIHTWLAWQAEPGRPYGTAIAARFLDPDLPQADVSRRMAEAPLLPTLIQGPFTAPFDTDRR